MGFEETWLYKKAPSTEWKEMKVMVPGALEDGVLRVAEAHDASVSKVVHRALEWWFEHGKIEKERVPSGRRAPGSGELALGMLGVLAGGGQWKRIRILEELGVERASMVTAKNATRRLVRMGWARRVERGVFEITREGRRELERQQKKDT